MTLRAAIKRLREDYGSHDKFAAAVGTSRQTAIEWEKGRYPKKYRARLVSLGIPDELFDRANGTTEIADLAEQVAELLVLVARILVLVEASAQDPREELPGS